MRGNTPSVAITMCSAYIISPGFLRLSRHLGSDLAQVWTSGGEQLSIYGVFSLFNINLVRIAPHNIYFTLQKIAQLVQTTSILIDTSVINVLWISSEAYLNNYVAGMATSSKWRLGARRPLMTWGKVPSGRLAPFHSGRLAPMCFFLLCSSE